MKIDEIQTESIKPAVQRYIRILKKGYYIKIGTSYVIIVSREVRNNQVKWIRKYSIPLSVAFEMAVSGVLELFDDDIYRLKK